MKIMLIGESISRPTGFGGQMKILAEGLAEMGHQVTVLCDTTPTKSDNPNLLERQCFNIFDLDKLDRTIHTQEPDVVICFWFLSMLEHLTQLRAAPANCPVYFWLPYEGSSLPKHAERMFRRIPKDRIVHLSKFAKNLWGDNASSDIIIPHGLHDEFLRPPCEDKEALTRRVAYKYRIPMFEDSVILLNVDRNVRHKRWDLTFDYVRRLKEALPNQTVQLIAHTKIRSSKESPYDLEELAKIYGIEENVYYTGFDWEKPISRDDLADLYEIADFRVSTSEGEGFGIPTIEAGAMGCPQILVDHTLNAEILGPSSPFLITPAATECHRDELWKVPDIEAMVSRTVELYHSLYMTTGSTVCETTRSHIRETYSKDRVVQAWADLIVPPAPKAWYDHRWGYQNYYNNLESSRALALLIQQLGIKKTLQIGTFQGEFIDYALSMGLDVIGLEPDIQAYQMLHPFVAKVVKCAPYGTKWPTVDAIVITDEVEVILRNNNSELAHKVYTEACKQEWLFLRRNPTYIYGVPIFDRDALGLIVAGEQMIRRYDLEKMVKENISGFDHEIWRLGPDTSYIPPGLLQCQNPHKAS